MLTLGAGTGYFVTHQEAAPGGTAWPVESQAKHLLNTTHRHREWVNLPVGSSGMRVFTVYPERADNAPVILITSRQQSASLLMRAIAVRLADEGYIAVVPDILSGRAPNGGDADSFVRNRNREDPAG